MREAVPEDAASLEDVLASTRVKIADQDFYLWEDGAPVAVAGRTRPTPARDLHRPGLHAAGIPR